MYEGKGLIRLYGFTREYHSKGAPYGPCLYHANYAPSPLPKSPHIFYL